MESRAAWNAEQQQMRECIDRHCRECLYDPRPRAGWQEQVDACPHDFCPLWAVRAGRERAHGH